MQFSSLSGQNCTSELRDPLKATLHRSVVVLHPRDEPVTLVGASWTNG